MYTENALNLCSGCYQHHFFQYTSLISRNVTQIFWPSLISQVIRTADRTWIHFATFLCACRSWESFNDENTRTLKNKVNQTRDVSAQESSPLISSTCLDFSIGALSFRMRTVNVTFDLIHSEISKQFFNYRRKYFNSLEMKL